MGSYAMKDFFPGPYIEGIEGLVSCLLSSGYNEPLGLRARHCEEKYPEVFLIFHAH